MTRAVVAAAAVLWLGATLTLSELRWFARRSLAERLHPYSASAAPRSFGPGILSAESFGEAVGPLAGMIGERIGRLFGVDEELSVRLSRMHAVGDVTAFRLRQLGAAVAAMAVAAGVVAAFHLPLVIALIGLFGAPLLAFLVPEQRVAAQAAAWQRRVFLELPVVAEQLAMLLSSGFSLGAALNRVAQRGRGACAEDLRRVMARVQHGLTEADALREWAALVRVDAVDRLVAHLAFYGEAADLGRLVGDEARSIRREVQRQLVEIIERRAQTVWIPVTVATLIPGVILLAVPFTQALRLFTTG